jgi:hypothetical protein
MKIIIINVSINWVYRLYEEYILSFQKIIKKNFKDIDIFIEYINSVDFDDSLLTKIFKKKSIKKLLKDDLESYKYPFHLFDKIFYSGETGIFNNSILPFLLKLYGNDIKKKLFFINIEQLSKDSYFKLIQTINSDINIIDYSEENIKYLNSHYKSFLFPPIYDNFCINKNNKYIDVLSITNNSYRENFFNNISINDIYLKKNIDNLYGYERNTLFDNTKIYINIHCSSEHLTMEMIRIVNLIMRKVIVISQKSIFSDILFLNKYIIICENKSDFEKKINEILIDYDNYFNDFFSDFNYQLYFNYVKNNLEKILF